MNCEIEQQPKQQNNKKMTLTMPISKPMTTRRDYITKISKKLT